MMKTHKRWIQQYHKKPEIMRFKNDHNSFTKTDKEHFFEFKTIFHKVYNSDVTIDRSLFGGFRLDESQRKISITNPVGWIIDGCKQTTSS